MKLNLNTLKAGAKVATKPQALATVAGLAGSRVLEVAAYKSARGVFGTNTGPGSLTGAQRTARVLYKAAYVVLAGGLLVTRPNEIAKGAGVGLVAGGTWHILNDFGINV